MSEDFLGTITHISEGGMSGDHPPADEPILVAPSTADEWNAVHLEIRPIASWRLDDPRFNFDSSFIQKEAGVDFRGLANLIAEHDGAPLTVFGHADPVGRDAYNRTLSGRRALAVYAVLTRRADLWEDLYQNGFEGDQWSLKNIKQILAALGYTPGPIDGFDRQVNQDAVRAFQQDHSDEVKVDGKLGPETRKCIFKKYMDYLCTSDDGKEAFSLPASAFLGGGADADGKCDYQACGELNAVKRFSADDDKEYQKASQKHARDDANAPNRRVVAYLFPPGVKIPPKQWPCPTNAEGDKGASACKKQCWSDAKQRRSCTDEARTFGKNYDTFACRFYHRLAIESPPERLLGCRALTIQLKDHLGLAYANKEVMVVVDQFAARTATSNEDGLLITYVPEGDCTLQGEDGSTVYFGDEYEAYKHDPVQELGTVEPFPYDTPPFSQNDVSDDDEVDNLLAELDDALDDASNGTSTA